LVTRFTYVHTHGRCPVDWLERGGHVCWFAPVPRLLVGYPVDCPVRCALCVTIFHYGYVLLLRLKLVEEVSATFGVTHLRLLIWRYRVYVDLIVRDLDAFTRCRIAFDCYGYVTLPICYVGAGADYDAIRRAFVYVYTAHWIGGRVCYTVGARYALKSVDLIWL